jgi:hypothetical protein
LNLYNQPAYDGPATATGTRRPSTPTKENLQNLRAARNEIRFQPLSDRLFDELMTRLKRNPSSVKALTASLEDLTSDEQHRQQGDGGLVGRLTASLRLFG